MAYLLVGFFSIPVLAGEKEIQQNNAKVLEKYWMIEQLNDEKNPKEMSNRIQLIALDDDMVRIKKYIESIDYELLLSCKMKKQIIWSNAEQQEGLQLLIKNKHHEEELWSLVQFDKMDSVPSAFKRASGKPDVSVIIPENIVRQEKNIERQQGRMTAFAFTLCMMGGGIGVSVIKNEIMPAVIGAGCGVLIGLSGSLKHDAELHRCYPEGAIDIRKKSLFKQPRISKLNKKFINNMVVREKQFDQLRLLKE